jgi:hypothetical protein
MFRKFIHRLERLGWKKQAQSQVLTPLELAIEREEKEKSQQGGSPQPQHPGIANQYEGLGLPSEQQPEPIDSDRIQMEAKDMIFFIKKHLAGKTRQEVAVIFPKKWKNDVSKRTFGNLLDNAEEQGWGLGNWVEGWVADEISGKTENVAIPAVPVPASIPVLAPKEDQFPQLPDDEDEDQFPQIPDDEEEDQFPQLPDDEEDVNLPGNKEGVDSNEKLKSFHNLIRDFNKDRFEAMESTEEGKMKTDRFFSEALSPNIQVGNRRVLDKRVGVLLNPIIFNAVKTYPSFMNRLQRELAANDMTLDDVQNVVSKTNKTKINRLDIDHKVMQDMMFEANGQEGIHSILFDLSQPQENENPIRQKAHEELWRLWYQIYNSKSDEQAWTGPRLEDQLGDTTRGHLVDTERAHADKIHQRTDPEQTIEEQKGVAKGIQGLSIEKADVLKDMSEYLNKIAGDYISWQMEQGGKKWEDMDDAAKAAKALKLGHVHEITYDNKTYHPTRSEMLRSYMDAVSSQISELLDPKNFDSRAIAIKNYNKEKPLDEQIRVQNKDEAKAEEYLNRGARMGKGYSSIGVVLVREDGGPLGYDFDFSKLVGSKALSQQFAIRAKTRTEAKRKELEGRYTPDAVRAEISKKLGVPMNDDFNKRFTDEYINSAREMSDDEYAVVKKAGEDQNMAARIRGVLRDGWTKTYPYIFEALNADNRYSKEQIRMFADTIGFHGKFDRPMMSEAAEGPTVTADGLREQFGTEWYNKTPQEMANEFFQLPDDMSAKEDMAKERYSEEGASFLTAATGMKATWEYKNKKWRLVSPEEVATATPEEKSYWKERTSRGPTTSTVTTVRKFVDKANKIRIDEGKKPLEYPINSKKMSIPPAEAIAVVDDIIPSGLPSKDDPNYQDKVNKEANKVLDIQKKKWKRKIAYATRPENVEKIWTHLKHVRYEDIPQGVREWMKFRKNQVSSRPGKKYPFKERYPKIFPPEMGTGATVPQMPPTTRAQYERERGIYVNSIRRIASLVQIRNRLDKFAAKGDIEFLISCEIKKARKSLHW